MALEEKVQIFPSIGRKTEETEKVYGPLPMALGAINIDQEEYTEYVKRYSIVERPPSKDTPKKF
ncbi:hypothetical protein CL616_03435 [archaeon]|nr:hypothetical protein [archaeon]|tara:strand:- start:1225 stop:1416 length:192 start_codon:yes stop_codon:yes gene_type:complete